MPLESFGFFPEIQQLCKLSMNLLNLADISRVSRYMDSFGYIREVSSVHKPAKVSRFEILSLTTPKSVQKPARVCRFMTHIRKVPINLQSLAGL